MITSGLRAKTCRFCSVVSKRNGEGPIDAVCLSDEYLILEVTPPRPPSTWIQSGAMTASVIDLVQEIYHSEDAPFR